MRYKNAQDVFPEEVLVFLQQYVDGEYIYIPRKADNRKRWGENTQSKTEIEERNEKIYAQYKLGQRVSDLALIFYLSEKSIQRIISLGKKQEQAL